MLKVSKIDAARRQLDSAVRLWFENEDPVTIHALVFAAYQIAQDINEKKGDKSITLLEMTRTIVKPEHVELTMQHFKKPMAFFKHANRDPNDILDFDPEMTDVFIYLAIRGLMLLGEQASDPQKVFMLWQDLHHDNEVMASSKLVKESIGAQALDELRKVDKRDFLKMALLSIAQAKARG